MERGGLLGVEPGLLDARIFADVGPPSPQFGWLRDPPGRGAATAVLRAGGSPLPTPPPPSLRTAVAKREGAVPPHPPPTHLNRLDLPLQVSNPNR